MKSDPSLVTREFHVARAARRRYGLDTAWFSITGNVVLADLAATRRLALAMNQARDAARHPERTVQAGALHAMGLIDEILHYVAGLYRRDVRRDAMAGALDFAERRVGREPVAVTLRAFTEHFPPLAVHRGDVDLERHLAGATAGVSHRELALEELVMLGLANQNPAFEPFRELFDDAPLAGTAAPAVFAALDEYFAGQPPFGPDHQALLDMLRSPMRAAPNSLSGQLDYIRTRWGHLLGDLLRRLLVTLDVIREDERALFMRFGARPWAKSHGGVPTFGGLEQEREAFTPDRDWMPTVVLLAKNAHVWLDQLSRTHGRAIRRLDEIPDAELERLRRWGVTALWLIGLWERSPASRRIKQLTGNPDADASAYSLLGYRIAAALGGEEACSALRERAARHGIRLASDMVPNHMGIDSWWVMEHPEWFLSLDHSPYPGYRFEGPDLSWDANVGIHIEDHYYDKTDAAVVFKRVDRRSGAVRFVYHGNDGTLMPWNDTAQLDYLRADVREAVIRTILEVARSFPVIRLDAAMTLAKRHYQRLWFPQPGGGGAIPSRAEHGLTQEEFDRAMPVEFWREVVDRVAAESPDTLLLAEAFWLMEGYFVRTLGMHRVYNSAFMNMLRDEDNASYRSVIKNTLEFDPEVLKRYVNFMSNPDERTAIDQFGSGDKYFGVCTLMVTLPGLPMFGHGQIEGFTERYGMEFRRASWDETVDRGLVERHEREIFPLLHRRRVFAEARGFELYDFFTADGHVNEDVFAYSNRDGDQRALVLYHNRYASTSGWIRESTATAVKDGERKTLRRGTLGEALGLARRADRCCVFREARSGLEYVRRSADLVERGLYAQLDAYACQVYVDFREVASDGDRPWNELEAELGGRGVPSADAALDELRLRRVVNPYRELVNADHLRRLAAGRIQAAPAAGAAARREAAASAAPAREAAAAGKREHGKHTGSSAPAPLEPAARESYETLRAQVLERALRTAQAARDFTHGAGDPEAAARRIGAALDANAEGSAPAAASGADLDGAVRIAWLLTQPLGGVSDAVPPAARAREWLRSWRWDRVLEEALQGLGAAPWDARRGVARVDAMLGHAAPFRAAAKATAGVPALLESCLADDHVQDLLQVNQHEGTWWFHKESWESLVHSLAAAAAIDIRVEAGGTPAANREVAACRALAEQLVRAADEAGYRLDGLVARVGR